ncbi:MAG: hypothetical protein WC426_14255 [Sulfuriferula sp.]
MSKLEQSISLADLAKAGGDPNKIPAIARAIKAVDAEQASPASTLAYISDKVKVNGCTLYYPTLAHRWLIDSIHFQASNTATKTSEILYILSRPSEDVFASLAEEFDNGELRIASLKYVVETLQITCADAIRLANRLLEAGMDNQADADPDDSKKKTDTGSLE